DMSRGIHLADTDEIGVGVDLDDERLLAAVAAFVDFGETQVDGFDLGDFHVRWFVRLAAVRRNQAWYMLPVFIDQRPFVVGAEQRRWIMMRVSLLCGVAVLALACGSLRAKEKLSDDVTGVLDKALEIELFSLDPTRTEKKPKDDFHG